MALGINFDGGGSSGGGKFLPVVKFDAKVGDFIAVNREPQGDGSWDKVEVEIDLPIKAVADFANLSVGWITFAPTYSATLAPAGEKMPAKPSADHKQAVSLKLFFKEHGLREFTPTSKTVMRVIDQLHDQFIAEAGDNKGKMPVIEFSGTETVKVRRHRGSCGSRPRLARSSAGLHRPTLSLSMRQRPAQQLRRQHRLRSLRLRRLRALTRKTSSKKETPPVRRASPGACLVPRKMGATR